MSSASGRSKTRLAKAVAQRLESLHRAGVTHVRPPKPQDAPPRTATPEAMATKTTATKTPATAAQPTTAAAAPAKAAKPALAPKAPAPKAPATVPAAQAPAPARQSATAAKAAASVAAPAASAPNDGVAALAAIATEVAQCTRCAELAASRTQTVFGSGNPRPRLVFMGEAPGADEDRQGLPFVGRAGQLLTDMIEKGMRLQRSDVYILNTIKCRPPGNRTPSDEETANCREYFQRQLDILRPEFICCLGAVAAHALLEVKTAVGQLRGYFHDYRGAKVICTYHPAYLLRNPPAKKQTWEDLQLLMSEMGLSPPGSPGPPGPGSGK